MDALVRAGAGRRFRDAEPLAIDLPERTPRRQAERDGRDAERGRRLRVNTGYSAATSTTAWITPFTTWPGKPRSASVTASRRIHLTDDAVEVVTISPQKLRTRKDKSSEMLAALTAGWFPAEIDSVTCPRCPHFFICAALPNGPVVLA